MKIEIAPSDGIEQYEKEMDLIYDALEMVTGEDFSGALVTDESYITDFLAWGNKPKRDKQRADLESALGLSLENPSLIHLCFMLRRKATT